MQRSYVIKAALIFVLLIIALVSLYPTLRLSDIREQETVLVNEIVSLSGLSRGDVNDALINRELNALLRRTASGDTLERVVALGGQLAQVYDKLQRVEANAIHQGLDLQGGTYLVYEADLPQLIRERSKRQDEELEQVITEVQNKTESGGDFFTVLSQVCRERDISLNRYWGRKGETDDTILSELRSEADDAINRTLEKLRIRIDRFGVSEPSITKQGNRRIIIELAGIQNIERAKSIIGTTALLEFKLVKEAEIVWSVLNDIDRVMVRMQKGESFTQNVELDTETTQIDSSQFADGSQSKDKEVSLSDLFGNQATDVEESTEEDTSILVDERTFSEKPFSSMLRQLPGRNVIAIPMQNVRSVQRILQLPEVQAVIPRDSEFLFARDLINAGEEQFQRLYLLKKEPELLGAMLADANVQISGGGSNFNAGEPEVHMSLNNDGVKIFARVTGMNVGKQLAIVLDGRVASAPNITERVPSGSASITGIGDMKEAQDLALVLRTGALPTPVQVITENTVGPSLGRDSIEKGQRSVLIGLLLVILFMIIYYRASGVIADFALILNIVFVLAIMAGFHATLTLPGIAGIILTVGMAVDANVLIFERIREELHTGKTIRAAIDSGYGRAFKTILDANITTLITAVVLYNFGTGAIKGFALTLSIGIMASMFTAIVVTRLVFDIITSRFAIKKLSI